MQKGRVLIVCGAVLASGAIMFPVLRAPSGGAVAGTATWAWLAVMGLAMAGLVALVGDRRDSLAGLTAVAASAAIAFGLVVASAVIIDGVLATRDLPDGPSSALGTGMWLLAAGCCVAVVGLIVGLSRRIG